MAADVNQATAQSLEDRPLPHSLEAERAVLGAILLDNASLAAVRHLVQAGEFFHDHHRRIFERMERMATAGKPIDLITLTEDLQRCECLDSAGGVAYVAELLDGVARVSNVEHYAGIIAEKAQLRAIIRAAHSLEQEGLQAGTSATALLLRANQLFGSIAADRPRDAKLRLATAKEFAWRDATSERPWIVGCLLPAGSQTIWQGRPKVGKSHTLLQLALDAACGVPVFGHFRVARPITVAYVELEEPEAVTKGRWEKMLWAQGDCEPASEKMLFLSREDLLRSRLLPRELTNPQKQLRAFAAELLERKVELVILIALRSLLPGDAREADVAERMNDALDFLASETHAAIALGHHNRKAPAQTSEAQGLGSTFFAARADAIFDMARANANVRRIRVEARYSVPEEFFLARESARDGEWIRWASAPADAREDKRGALRERVAAGQSIRQAAAALGVPPSTAKRWVAEA
jgi:replicative DNA helicase